jgi:hypothetical protein
MVCCDLRDAPARSSASTARMRRWYCAGQFQVCRAYAHFIVCVAWKNTSATEFFSPPWKTAFTPAFRRAACFARPRRGRGVQHHVNLAMRPSKLPATGCQHVKSAGPRRPQVQGVGHNAIFMQRAERERWRRSATPTAPCRLKATPSPQACRWCRSRDAHPDLFHVPFPPLSFYFDRRAPFASDLPPRWRWQPARGCPAH